MSLEEIQSWWEVPCIAHFCSLFRSAFDLPDFDIEDLEEALIDSCREENNFFLTDLMCKLLRGYYGREDIETFNCEVFLKDTFKYNWEMLEKREGNPLANSSFKDLPLRTKVEILQCLCDYRLDATDIMDQLKGFDGDNMRIEPLGKDSVGAKYWYFYGSRLYKEDPEPEEIKQKGKKKEKKAKETNKKKQKKKKESVKTSRGRKVKKTVKEEESSDENTEEEVESDSEDDISLSQLTPKSTPRGKRNNKGRTPGRPKATETKDRKEPEVRRSSRGRILTKKGPLYSDDEQSPAVKQNAQNRTVTPVRSGRRGRPSRVEAAVEKAANSDSGIEEENEDDSITPRSSRQDSISSVTENSTPRGGSTRKQKLTTMKETPERSRSGRRGRPPKANKNRNNNSSAKSSQLSSVCNSEDSVPQPEGEAIQGKSSKLEDGDSKEEAMDSKVEVVDSKLEAGDNKVEAVDSKLEAGDSKVEAVDSKLEAGDSKPEVEETKQKVENSKSEVEDRKPMSGDCKLEVIDSQLKVMDSTLKVVDSKPEVEDSKPDVELSKITSCANGNIEKKEEGMEIDEKIETNDEISLENEKEIKEEDTCKSELQTTPNSSQVLDEKEQENRINESTIEREDDEMEADDDENDEQEVDVDDARSETMEDPKEEATLDEDNQGSTGEEGPRKLRARATANSIDVISEGTEKTAAVTEKRERQPFPKRPLNPNVRWHLICVDLDDWEGLAELLKDSKVKCERDLYKCIVEDFLPAIPDIIEARLKEKLRREQENLPRRTSYRIELKRREQLEQEKILAEAKAEEEKQRQAEEEERRKKLEAEREEEEKKAREERQRAREERAKRLALREQRAALLAEGKEIPPELMYVANTNSSKYVDDHDSYTNRVELDEEVVEEMNRVLEMVKAHKDAWPFEEPVAEEEAPGYHDIIKRPMDLSTIEKKLTSRAYRTKNRFIQDLNLMLDNCRQFNGENSDLGEMASRLQRFVNRLVKQHLEKPSSAYEVDEDFRVSRCGENVEKKFRPKRGASSRARDTLRKAMDDDEFEQAMDEDDDDYYDDEDSNSSSSRSSRKRQNRLIPELSPTINLRELIKRPLVINPNTNSKLEWDPEKKVVRLNGQNVVNTQFVARGETQKFSPYQVKSGSGGSGGNCFVMDSSGNLQHTVTHNGKTFIFQNKPNKVTPRLASSSSPSTPQRSLLTTVSQKVQEKAAGQSELIAGHGQGGGSVKVSLPISQSALTPGNQFVVQTPQGPKTIRIVSTTAPTQTVSSATGSQTQSASPAVSGEGIKVSGGMLVVDGQVTGIPVSGKTKIIYKAPQGVGSPGASSGKTIVKLVTTPDGNRILQTVGQPAIIRAMATQPPKPGTTSQPAIIQAPTINQNILQSPVIRGASPATKPQSRGRLIPELSAESGFSGFVPPGLQEGANSQVQAPQSSVTATLVTNVVGGASSVSVPSHTMAAPSLVGNVTSASGQNQPQKVILSMMPGGDLLLPTPVQNINQVIDNEVHVHASVSGSQQIQPQTNNESVNSDVNSAVNQVIEDPSVSIAQKRKLENSDSEMLVPNKQWQGEQTVSGGQDSSAVTYVSMVSSAPTEVFTESTISNLPVVSTVQLVSGTPVVSQFPAVSNVLVGSNVQIPVVSNIPSSNVGSSVQLVSSLPLVSNVPTGSSIQFVPLITTNVTQQNSPAVESLTRKGNLFDNLETLVPSTQPTVVTNGISNQNPPTQGTTPPSAPTPIFKLSPEVMNKVSMFAANLHSNSLASKLQGLTKSPSQSTQSGNLTNIVLTNPLAATSSNLTTIATTVPQQPITLLHAGNLEPTASSQQAVHVTGPHLTAEEMVQAGLVPKHDHV